MKNKLSRKHQTLLNDAPKQIIRLEADINYTVFYMQSGKTQVMSYSLKNYQDSLTFSFVRVNKSCIINLHFLAK
ncbi:LytTR family transcriptional regulator DNA-binding domain-containing protein [Emticicia aquatilis]|uniref:LytTR family transcriptional regulator DNA-binding domain-containing protein n=1 Tax=Emticicia aquatilis TaxID=1537369 RepID=UPI00166633D5|nr:LytTR family transcriptional regulator DNA-binding domain-containing protein [Emticicia aquatilis]